MPYRIQRINHLIRQEISDMLQREVKDPRLGNFVAITDVNTTADLKHAKVFISFIGTEEEKQKTIGALTNASGYFRSELAKRIRMRRIPELSFHWDSSIERGAHIIQLMDKVKPREES